jgi:hypothetical protein
MWNVGVRFVDFGVEWSGGLTCCVCVCVRVIFVPQLSFPSYG